jgi:threonine dehydratase
MPHRPHMATRTWHAAVKFLLTRLKILVEPSGAVGAAALLFGRLPGGVGKVGVILSAGNMDFDQLAAFDGKMDMPIS